MEKIFDGLYQLSDGTNLKWNKFLRGWQIVGNVSFDILLDNISLVDFDEIKKKEDDIS